MVGCASAAKLQIKMNTTILIGYGATDASGNPKGPPSVVSGPPASVEESKAQAVVFDEAKRGGKFPSGVKYLAFANVAFASVAVSLDKSEAHDTQPAHAQKRKPKTE